MEAKIYNQKGKESGSITLPESVFSAKWRADLVHQVVESMRSNGRAGTAHAKDRGEVRGGGKKPWKQKGTGRARHGSSRSPIWVGGGVAHGPLKDKNYKRKISKKMRVEALFSVLSKKLKDGEIIFVDSLDTDSLKTKDASEIAKKVYEGAGMKVLAKSKNKKVLVAFYENSKSKFGFRNLPELQVSLLKNLNPLEAVNYKYILIEKPVESVKFLESRAN
ncbi:MAG: 50S ribosomal protein L4 [Candidatus Pacebacteria bacterium]|nr:50S ribosomal protein L4 [Candidatus Paceibacterota bacterium]MCF7862490.1 50S ribosomal protein L4 [Candidatus Paceibacterota bacterium]